MSCDDKYDHVCIICGEYGPTKYKACIKHKCIICESPIRNLQVNHCDMHGCGYLYHWLGKMCDNPCEDGVCEVHRCRHFSPLNVRCNIVIRPGYKLYCSNHMCLYSLGVVRCGKHDPTGNRRCAEHRAYFFAEKQIEFVKSNISCD